MCVYVHIYVARYIHNRASSRYICRRYIARYLDSPTVEGRLDVRRDELCRYTYIMYIHTKVKNKLLDTPTNELSVVPTA